MVESNNLEEGIAYAKSLGILVVITLAAKGSLIVTKDDVIEIKAEPVSQVLDSTGAGDLYAAGFLYGLTKNMRHHECANLGSFLAAQVISRLGPRTGRDIKDLAISEGFLE